MARLAATVPPPHRKRATALRLAGALHFAVLSGRAPALAAAYPEGRDDWDIAVLWPAARAYLEADSAHVERFIASDPQTNETRRAIALLPGFLEIARRYAGPIHLLELGASAGLNQSLDQFSYSTREWQRLARPDRGVSIDTAWQAPPPNGAFPQIASRAACDLNPIDLSDPEARLRLKAFTWADQPERLARLDAAIALALSNGVRVEQADAAEWLETRLATRPRTGTTVVFHSVFLHYPPTAVRERIIGAISAAGQAATHAAPLAWLCMEAGTLFTRDNPALGQFLVRLQTWPGGDVTSICRTDGHVTHVTAA